jgi:hypothetical protein
MFRLVAMTGAVLAVTLGLWAAAPESARAQGTLTAMCTSAGQTAPCTSSWYGSSVTVVWTASPPPNSPTSGCELGIAYSYASDAVTSLFCSATWSDGSFASVGFPLHVEVSAPAVQAIPARAPDHHGWYTHPVSVAFTGSAFSGILACSPSALYGGPSSAGAAVTGSCTDNAGKIGTAASTIKYDAAPPHLGLRASPADRVVGLRWTITGPAPVSRVRVIRTPGLRGRRSSVIYSGHGTGVSDHSVVDGRRYRYSLQVTDQAGNVAVQAIAATPGPRLVAPGQGARLRAPPLLSWTPVTGATYYNVQLYRGRKVLSTWPARATLQLRRTWRFNGRRYALRPGRYRWYVWPGFGAPAAARYGRLIGSRTFVIS